MFGDGTWNSHTKKGWKQLKSTQIYLSVAVCIMYQKPKYISASLNCLQNVLMGPSKLKPSYNLCHCAVITIHIPVSESNIPIGREKWNLGILVENYEQYAAKNIWTFG